ncbi:MAG: class I SAM-dependent methyltransferase [Deltaproteobacteria bacterium]|nr:class I SAM-dependent methyltransferase [Deltaproteobacteria bacterium]
MSALRTALAAVSQDIPGLQPAHLSPDPQYDRDYVYRQSYQNLSLKGTDVTRRPWNIYAIIARSLSPTAVMVDVGCGTAYKSIRHAAGIRLLIGLEPNEKMIGQAVQNAMTASAFNVCFMTGTCDALPFVDNSIDVVTALLAPHNAQEMHRVLKPGGWAIVERVGDRDKVNIKQYFGSDAEGPRGQLLHYEVGTRAVMMTEEFQGCFSHATARNGFWDTAYTMGELLVLLAHTPTIRNYVLPHDQPYVDAIQASLVRDGKIRTTQNRVLVVAQK